MSISAQFSCQKEWLSDLPVKKREIQDARIDSSIWNKFVYRNDDIIVSSYPKSGTTWLQQIVAMIISEGDPDFSISEKSPWLEYRWPSEEMRLDSINRQMHRRIIKTHLPLDALPYSTIAKYIYIARDGRDVALSLHNHHKNLRENVYDRMNNGYDMSVSKIEAPTDSFSAYFHEWIEKDGHPYWPYWDSIRSWWGCKNIQNIMLVNYFDLQKDLYGEIRRIADFLGVTIQDEVMPSVLTMCGFDYMRANGSRLAPFNGSLWINGHLSFFNSGKNGRWRDMLSSEQIQHYDELSASKLGIDCARWLNR